MSIKIESMKDSDLEKVIDVQSRSFSSDLREDLSVFQDRFKKFGEHFLVATVDDNIIGYAICFPWKLGAVPENNKNFPLDLESPDSFYLHDICLLGEARGLGIANMMLNKIYERAAIKGFQTISLVSVEQSGDYWDRNSFISVEVSSELREKLFENYGGKARLMSKNI